jgi:calcineurin-like phosphoesterase family protein
MIIPTQTTSLHKAEVKRAVPYYYVCDQMKMLLIFSHGIQSSNRVFDKGDYMSKGKHRKKTSLLRKLLGVLRAIGGHHDKAAATRSKRRKSRVQ